MTTINREQLQIMYVNKDRKSISPRIIISKLLLEDRIDEAISLAKSSGISPDSDTLEGRLQQGDYEIAKQLAKQRIDEFTKST